jgi:BirA family biotin operon repressor/biotin-[acetyl-CoA-carboxylase] ligase
MKIIELDKTTSTNQYLMNLASEGKAVHETIVIAEEQTAGKGQGENLWVSEPGMNLTFSMYVKYLMKANTQAWMSKSIALAVFDFISLYTQNAVIKWPNDILVNDKKIAGILIEHFITGQNLNGTVIGVGVNLNQEKFPAEIQAISLKEITGAKFKVKDALKTMSVCLKSRLHTYELQKWDNIDSEYHKNLLGYGRVCVFRLKTGKETTAFHRGVDALGRIVLETPGVEKNFFDVQEVKWVGFK